MDKNGFDIGLFDDDDSLRYIFPTIAMAIEKKKELGWGHIYKISYKKIGKKYT